MNGCAKIVVKMFQEIQLLILKMMSIIWMKFLNLIYIVTNIDFQKYDDMIFNPLMFDLQFTNIKIRSYQTLFQYHTSKQTSIKNATWYWGHDLQAKKAWDNHALNKGFNKYTHTFKNKNT